MRWYPLGGDTDEPLTVTLRAFTGPGGGLYSFSQDIRDAHVWASGTFEHWFPVRGLVSALANAVHGRQAGEPMAVIERCPA
jgi:hypothetical protein